MNMCVTCLHNRKAALSAAPLCYSGKRIFRGSDDLSRIERFVVSGTLRMSVSDRHMDPSFRTPGSVRSMRDSFHAVLTILSLTESSNIIEVRFGLDYGMLFQSHPPRVTARSFLKGILPLLQLISACYMAWKALSLLADTPFPIMVVTTESMAAAFRPGDVLLISNHHNHVAIGDLPVL